MKDTIKAGGKGKKKLRGWLLALIIVVVVFAGGALCCTLATNSQNKAKALSMSAVELSA